MITRVAHFTSRLLAHRVKWKMSSIKLEENNVISLHLNENELAVDQILFSGGHEKCGLEQDYHIC